MITGNNLSRFLLRRSYAAKGGCPPNAAVCINYEEIL